MNRVNSVDEFLVKFEMGKVKDSFFWIISFESLDD